uniref:JmjC domain-containing protein n=1 Tax=Noctiluca scintillans TaxID=2966 RepID=A0A7S1APA9_NOCSC|mmetsp:Transcript_54558/g.145675  ORF Transcript_54558/g.145675 Transcript_54558/m.145675 type:complete len:457 (+) Transcript_54558:51-1421(+)|eukprot:CAMPEP_0194529912 /NCGR_PEP_ID=MMETSP0253-20130528/66722_1 /TAXON_ID=2966 /ORGANISM="Noctiluca scintillans" /LENGTH=456 /DNA_ID=CAMNT_0039375089 /DNA_START=41 /DNA_END=1411 /DNA_ORIENTATION=-
MKSIFVAVWAVAVSDDVCTSPQCTARCTLEHVLDGADDASIQRLFEQEVSKPVLVRGLTDRWPIYDVAQKGWTVLQDDLVERYGDLKVFIRSAAHIANFGGQGGEFSSAGTLESFLDTIDAGTGSIAFNALSDLGAKMKQDELFDMRILGDARAELLSSPVTSIGGDKEGLTFHTHGEAALGLVFGRKEWLLMPPGDMTDEILGSSLNTSAYLSHLAHAEWPHGMHYCDQRAGDILFVPHNWWHATVNHGVTIGVGGQNPTVDSAKYWGQDIGSNLSLPDLEIAARSKLQSKDEEMVAFGVAGLLRAFDIMPTKLSVTWHLCSFLQSQKQTLAAKAHLLRVFDHLRNLERRIPLSELPKKDFASLYEYMGSLSINTLDQPVVALEFLRESLRLDDTSPAAWVNSAYSIMKLSPPQLKKYGFTEEKRRREVQRRIEVALSHDPEFRPALSAMRQLSR